MTKIERSSKQYDDILKIMDNINENEDNSLTKTVFRKVLMSDINDIGSRD